MQINRLRRREFITLFGGAAAAWPVAARGQQPERPRRIGVLQNLAADDAEGQLRLTALAQGLQELGWMVGRNLRIDYRWGGRDADRVRKNVAEVVALAPDVILAAGSTNLAALREVTRSISTVFVGITDPVGAGHVASLSKPGANMTGFAQFEYAFGAKWLELLKQISPTVTRVAVLRNPTQASGIGQFGAISAVAGSFGVELNPIDIRDTDEVERAIVSLSHLRNGGLIVPSSAQAGRRREWLVSLVNKYRLPAVYYRRFFVAAGGLISYGSDTVEEYRLAAGYIDRILRGAKPSDLPVQAPTKYELVINLKTATALGLTIPPMLLARADEVIE